MSTESEHSSGGVVSAAEGEEPLLDVSPETTAAEKSTLHVVNTDSEDVQPPPFRLMDGVMGSYTVWLAVLVLLIAVGNWRYDVYTMFETREDFQARYTEYLTKRWSREGEALLANASLDPSFTHYRGARIHFRAITRRVPIPGTTPTQFKVKIGLPEVDNENRWRGDEDETDDKWRELRNELRCVGEGGKLHFQIVGILSDGTRFLSTYMDGKEAEGHNLRESFPCFKKVVSMMCTGDKWEIVCAPEEAYGPDGDEKVPPAATTVWRISVESVESKRITTRKEAEALLAASVVHAKGTPRMTRKQLFEKAKIYLPVSKTL
ncbi:FKBP-type peptidyl-prolyl cis-trans isomerase, putative [Trypanosoma cruzi marinkellei]|uniref:peptidylprolyl isomerase n=1 Tax=Trypanosoma cruzi marinkellei TaxID=85056 RepID=K2NR82_TRYCR|nr:FKBP-type peptidyl-prolyl cis-trans isomerase, putative [Trypanosoma cruzi marinkellei]